MLGLYLGSDVLENADVVTGFERLMHNESLASNLIQSIFQLSGLVSRVDVDQNQIGSSSSKLNKRPFIVVGGIYSDTISWLESQTNEASC